MHKLVIIIISFLLLPLPQVQAVLSSNFSTGGTNFSVYDLSTYGTSPTEANWPLVRFVLTNYHENPQAIESQLSALCANRQEKIGFTLWYMAASGDSSFANSAGGKPSSLIENNLKTVLNLASGMKNSTGKTCFNEIQFRFAPIGNSNPGLWSSWNENIYQENKAFIWYVRSLVKSSVTQDLYFDLGVELGGITTGQTSEYLEKLWREYTSGFGTTDSYGFSVAVNPGRLSNLINLYKKVGTLPNQYAIDIYDPKGEGMDTQLTLLTEELRKNGELGKPILIQETFFSDNSAFASLYRAKAQGLNIRTIMQWQLTRDLFYRPDGQVRHFSTISPSYSYYSFNPTALTSACSNSATSVTLNWNPVSSAKFYYLRLDDIANNLASCQYSWYCPPSTDHLSEVKSPPITLPILPGKKYRWWVQTGTDLGTSDPTVAEFTCEGQSRPGDFNHDGTVNSDDYTMLKKNYGNPYTLLDFNLLVASYQK